MAENNSIVRILSRADSAQKWADNNPKLAAAELGYVLGTGQYKIGDGVHRWNDLPFANPCSGSEGQNSSIIFHEVENEKNREKLLDIIPNKNERHIIIYKNVPYFDANTPVTGEPKYTTIYVEKIGNGKDYLLDKVDDNYEIIEKGLPCLSTVICGADGDSSAIQIVEYEMYKMNTTNGTARSTATGKAAVALGRYNKVHGDNSMAINYNNKVEGTKNFAANSGN